MTPAQLRRVKEGFLRCLSRPRPERERAAREACLDDADVLGEILRLLRARGASPENGTIDLESSAAIDDGSAAEPTRLRPAEDRAERLRRPIRPGEVLLGRYEVRERMGAGAFGAVHRAFDRIARTEVAVKCVDLEGHSGADRFLGETAALRRARVPGVVEILAAARDGDRALIVMELAAGRPFPGPSAESAAVVLTRAAAVLDVLAGLHAAGVVHRDVKPANVLVSDAGAVTVVDLGVADDASDAPRRRATTVVAGTPAYMAPECLAGASATVRSDLYSLGVMCASTLVGETPERVKSLDRHQILSRLSDVLRPAVADALATLLETEPERRPATAAEAAARIRSALGAPDEAEFPFLGSDDPVRAVVAAAIAGRSVDLAGPARSGRTRTLREAEARLRSTGHEVHWVREPEVPQGPADEPGSAAPTDVLSADRLDRAVVEGVRHRVADGLIVFADDFGELGSATRALVNSLRSCGAVVRVMDDADAAEDSVRVRPLGASALAGHVRGPERIFSLRSEVAAHLHRRTGGRAGEVVRVIRDWCRTGLARWDDGLVVTPTGAERIARVARQPSAAPLPKRVVGRAASLWAALTLIGEPLNAADAASMLAVPQRVAEGWAEDLEREGLVTRSADGGFVEVVRSCPVVADVAPEIRDAWRERAAVRLRDGSENRFWHLAAAGRTSEACRAALDFSAVQVVAGNAAAAAAVLDAALEIARRAHEGDSDLYAELLAAMADAAITRATRGAVEVGLYHAALAPVRAGRAEAWIAVLDAAATVLDGDAARALQILAAAGDLPTPEHRRAAIVVANLAGRMSRSAETHRSRVADCARWARRRAGDRDARAVLAAATGWLRYEQGRFGCAARLHSRAARLTRRARFRASAVCNAAMAALEAFDLAAAESLGRQALQAGRRLDDRINIARAELVLRQVAYRSRRSDGADDELLEAAEWLGRGALRGTVLLNEAAVVWRTRALARAGALATDAAADLLSSGLAAGAALASALAAACGARGDPDALAVLAEPPGALGPPALLAQATALAAHAPGRVGPAASQVDRARAWALAASHPDVPREVLSPVEVLERLDPPRAGNRPPTA